MGGLSPQEIYQFLLQAGWPQAWARDATAISLAENRGDFLGSGRVPVGNVGTNKDGTRDVGIMQVNLSHNPALRGRYTEQSLTDPLTNARAALEIAQWQNANRGSWMAGWTTAGMVEQFRPYVTQGGAPQTNTPVQMSVANAGQLAPQAPAKDPGAILGIPTPFRPTGGSASDYAFDVPSGTWTHRQNAEDQYNYDYGSDSWNQIQRPVGAPPPSSNEMVTGGLGTAPGGQVWLKDPEGVWYAFDPNNPNQSNMPRPGPYQTASGQPVMVAAGNDGRLQVRPQQTNAPDDPMNLHDWTNPGSSPYPIGDPRNQGTGMGANPNPMMTGPLGVIQQNPSGNQWYQDPVTKEWSGASSQFAAQSDFTPMGSFQNGMVYTVDANGKPIARPPMNVGSGNTPLPKPGPGQAPSGYNQTAPLYTGYQPGMAIPPANYAQGGGQGQGAPFQGPATQPVPSASNPNGLPVGSPNSQSGGSVGAPTGSANSQSVANGGSLANPAVGSEAMQDSLEADPEGYIRNILDRLGRKGDKTGLSEFVIGQAPRFEGLGTLYEMGNDADQSGGGEFIDQAIRNYVQLPSKGASSFEQARNMLTKAKTKLEDGERVAAQAGGDQFSYAFNYFQAVLSPMMSKGMASVMLSDSRQKYEKARYASAKAAGTFSGSAYDWITNMLGWK